MLRSKRVMVPGLKSMPTVSPTLAGWSEAMRALRSPLGVSRVTIWVVPRYSVAMTLPRYAPVSFRVMCSGRTPKTRLPEAPSRNAGTPICASPSITLSVPAATFPWKSRKFIEGEPMKLATNMVAGLS